MQYIALLRGINVGGHTVKMERLKSIFAGCGVTAVRSFITSGNIFFTTERQDREVLTKEIESHLAKELGFNVPVFLRDVPKRSSKNRSANSVTKRGLGNHSAQRK